MKVVPIRARKKPAPVRHPFDLLHGVETSGIIPGRRLSSGHANDRHATAYFGVAPSILRELCDLWLAGGPPWPLESYTFLDFGAGKGRAMMLASEMPFREVVGIELNPEMAAIARRNLDIWETAHRARCPIRLLVQDATEFVFPEGPCLAYLYHPFEAPVLRRLLRRMAGSFAARPGELDLLYVNHEHCELLAVQAGFRQIWSGKLHMAEEDFVAEKQILVESDGEYATSGDEDCSIHRWVGHR